MTKIYKYGYAIDTWRLFRGALFDKYSDPYIETHPPRIAQRKNLFRWSMIAEEVGEYEHNYPDYVPYCSPQPFLMDHLPEKYGRHAFEHILEAKEFRIQQIESLLNSFAIPVESTDQSWRHIIKWLGAQKVLSKEARVTSRVGAGHGLVLRPVYHSLVLDVALLLGEHVIKNRPDYSWFFWGDARSENASGLGRSLWVLCEPLPSGGHFKDPPKRFLPVTIVSTAATNSDKIDHSSSLALISHLSE